PVDPSSSRADMARWLAEALAARDAGTQQPFAIIAQETATVIGSTRYLEIMPHDHTVEIGWTWLAKDARRTAVNTECKFLLLRHAFETLGAMRVQLKTDLRNTRSQNAIARIGGVREGVLRKHRLVQGGYPRWTVVFSIIDDEWPAVKARLEGWLPAPL
ncbi:MAG TPA: GNAT family protein, partial [Ktedonobacterales bacterium]|nr:GNAT family protein [Ktedonobacterales bacterium]